MSPERIIEKTDVPKIERFAKKLGGSPPLVAKDANKGLDLEVIKVGEEIVVIENHTVPGERGDYDPPARTLACSKDFLHKLETDGAIPDYS